MEQKNQPHIKQLFIRHAQGICTPEELALLLQYLQQGGHPEDLPGPEELQAAVPDMPLMRNAVAEQIVENILSAADAAAPARRMHIRPALRWMAAAAVAALVIGLAWRWWYTPPSKPALTTIATGPGQIREITLPDGSFILLNARSVLQYDSNQPGAAHREIWLQGEAFFQVAPAAARRFTVHAGNRLQVVVLGTRFNVHNRDSLVQVVLNSGRVKVTATDSANGQQELLLSPGETVLYRSAQGLLQKQPADTALLTGWKNNLFTFHETPLQDIAALIQQQFGVRVVFAQPQLARWQVNGAAPANDLDSLLIILEKSLDIRIDKSDSQIVIRPAH